MPRPENVSTLVRGQREVALRASDDECIALAKRMAVPGVQSLSASLQLIRQDDDLIEVVGQLSAGLSLHCAVTGHLFETVVASEFSRLFTERPDRVVDEADPMLDDIELLVGGSLDLGELVSEELGLAIPSYPRSDQADHHMAAHAGTGDDADPSPFDKLASLSGRRA